MIKEVRHQWSEGINAYDEMISLVCGKCSKELDEYAYFKDQKYWCSDHVPPGGIVNRKLKPREVTNVGWGIGN